MTSDKEQTPHPEKEPKSASELPPKPEKKRLPAFQQIPGRLHPEIMGAHIVENGIHFSVESADSQPPSLLLYTRQSSEPVADIPFPPENRFGNVYAMIVKGIRPGRHFYAFCSGSRIFCDPYARLVFGREKFGDAAHLTNILKAGFLTEDFDWEGDRPLKKDFDELVIYRLHVRGFTVHASSHVKGRGTFRGLIQKIPYLKELGITAVELMPVTEFEEVQSVMLQQSCIRNQISVRNKNQNNRNADRDIHDNSQNIQDNNQNTNNKNKALPIQEQNQNQGPRNNITLLCKPTGQINYWGYAPSFLFAPKFSYHSRTGGENQSQELKELVKALHQNQIEVIFELYFPQETNDIQVLEALRFWALEYHADGLHISGRSLFPAAAKDPILAETKLFATDWGDAPRDHNRLLAQYHDGFLADMRRFLKGDEGQLENAVFRTRQNPEHMGVVNYMAHSNGFTLYDMVSYDRKHNEANGEQNHDGTDCNHSWNCGIEGDTRGKAISRLRKNQLRNALAMVFLSQGIPLLEAGDECCHTKKGNNNTYCQDNELSWLNWRRTKNGEEIRQFVTYLIRLRREHAIFRNKTPLSTIDSQNKGYPPISFHGTNPWKPEFEPYRRQLGILYNAAYAQPPENHMFYVLYNMHWTDQEFCLPHLAGEAGWRMLIHTTKAAPNFYEIADAPLLEDNKTLTVPARTIILLMSEGEKPL